MATPPIALATLGMSDSILLMVLALVVFGPRRLPQIGRQIGKLMYEFRKASNDFKFQMEEELRNAEEADRRKREEEERQRTLAAAPPPAQLEATVPESTDASAATPELPAPEPPAAIAAESPNPDESGDFDVAATEPDVAAEETQEPAAEMRSDAGEMTQNEAAPAPTEAPAVTVEPTTPRILPPSTGVTVAAERPGAQPQQRELFGPAPDEPVKVPESVSPEAERSEPAAHHG